MPDLKLEQAARDEGFQIIAGIDEAGRGPWAGPVVAGAVILPAPDISHQLSDGLDDSKKLSTARREALFRLVKDEAMVGVGIADVEEIDRLNILQSTLLAMARAVEDLAALPDFALVDGNRTPNLACPARPVVKGDALSLSIAAASIVAKVTRDRLMVELAARYPEYGWERNAGYGTAEHQAALACHGVTPAHRRSYAPIRRLLAASDPPATD